MKESRYNVWTERGDRAYVYNGLTGALLELAGAEREGMERFIDGEDGACPPELLHKLTVGRMLVTDDADELGALQTRYQLSRSDPKHLGLTLVTSLGCNFDCPYCFEAKHPSIMSADVQAAVLQLLDDSLPRIRDFSVTWYGGEPLVGKQPLLALSDRFIERCDAHGVRYDASIVTNGFLLDRQTCEELRDRRIVSAQVTLDGPPEVHDRMRPYVGGKPTFWRIVENLRHAVDYLAVGVRMNVDTANFGRAEELMAILADQGLAGRLSIYPGQLVGYQDNLLAPSATYGRACFGNAEFARAERDFAALAIRYGFGDASLPTPTGAPCTAVRATELVVGSEGELYKCWNDVGNPRACVGDIRDYADLNGRLARWLKYDPFANGECRGCIALPVCMGGCAAHAMDHLQYENRCGTFRHTYQEQVESFVAAADAGASVSVPVNLVRRMESR